MSKLPTISPQQETKYDIGPEGLVNRVTREPIPPEEPVFILRAKDVHAVDALWYYYDLVQGTSKHRDSEHAVSIKARILAFEVFRRGHESRMKFPDSPPTI